MKIQNNIVTPFSSIKIQYWKAPTVLHCLLEKPKEEILPYLCQDKKNEDQTIQFFALKKIGDIANLPLYRTFERSLGGKFLNMSDFLVLVKINFLSLRCRSFYYISNCYLAMQTEILVKYPI